MDDQNIFIANVQEEVRKLHFQLKQKNDLVNSLKQFCEKKIEEDPSNEYGDENTALSTEDDDQGPRGKKSKSRREYENILKGFSEQE